MINVFEVSEFLNELKNELQKTKKELRITPKIETNIEEEIEKLNNELKIINQELNNYPKDKSFIDVNERSIFIIESKVKIEEFFKYKKLQLEKDKTLKELLEFYKAELTKEQSKISGSEHDLREKRIKFLNDKIQNYIEFVKESLGTYKDYNANFNYKSKSLEIRKIDTEFSENIDGLSIFVFLHLCLFLSLHEIFILNKRQFIPQFLIIDNLSLPFESNKLNIKLRNAFELLNDFISRINEDYKTQFQIILLEHAEPEKWNEPDGLSNFHLAKEYRNGNNLLNS